METFVMQQVNGFKTEDIQNTLNLLVDNPGLAQFKFRVSNKWVTGGHNRSTIKGFYGGGQEDTSRSEAWQFDNGEPPILLGFNEGANPVEFILHGLAGCMTTTMVLHAAARGIQLDSVESQLEGDLDVQGFLGLDENVRNGYQQIRVNFRIEGDLTEEQKQELESFMRKSPVYDVVTNSIPVKISIS
jgi:uncharacterized OsmC-like protein